ncbi:hypothetical protein OEZ86_000689 [Tetradesmus obliquus]|nr:hypothetical protein OEZ86_000689 [Tetradesmus obliquus]
MCRNYLRDYGGPHVDWPGDDVKPDWAALYPIPASKRIEDRPTKKRRHAQQAAARLLQTQRSPVTTMTTSG